jgi:signal peptidase I
MSLIKEIAVLLPILLVMAYLGSHLVVVPTGSMTPAINEGDLVFVQNTEIFGMVKEFDASDVKTGDIILYNSINETGKSDSVIHRVVATNESQGEKYYILKGDANQFTDDENVCSEDITSRVVTWGGNPIKIPGIGWILLWLKI